MVSPRIGRRAHGLDAAQLGCACCSTERRVLLNWAANAQPNGSGYAASTWVLGRGLWLPYNVPSEQTQLHLHTDAVGKPNIQDRMRVLSVAQQPIVAARYNHSSSAAFLRRSRGSATDPVQSTFDFDLGDQVFYWRGRSIQNMSRWAMH